jgi:hypothetical protein
MQKRWYDFDPFISLAVNSIENADEEDKKFCLNYIITKVKDSGTEIKKDINSSYNCFWQRALDSSVLFYEAMECFKETDKNTQREIAMFIIKYSEKNKKK